MLATFPASKEHNGSGEMFLCIPYDIEKILPFMCARYKDTTYKDLMNMGIDDFYSKINSIPKNEPLYEIIKSRVIDLSKIKDKEEKKYWQELKRVNRIPDIYKTIEEIHREIKMQTMKQNGGIKNANKFN